MSGKTGDKKRKKKPSESTSEQYSLYLRYQWLMALGSPQLLKWNGYERRSTRLLYVFVCFFGPDRAPTFNSIPIILNSLTNRNIAFFYSVIIYEQETKDCVWSGRLPTQTQLTTTPLFSTLMFVGFHNQFPLLTILPLSYQSNK